MRRLVFVIMAALPVGVVAAMVACTSTTHVYIARKFDTERQCLEKPTGIDVIDGDDPGERCALKCVVPPPNLDAAAPRSLYISMMCPPYPPGFDTTNVFPGCQEALAAGERNDLCLSDGGSTHPHEDSGVIPQDDAGFDAGADAGQDAGTDASEAGIEDAAADG
jgi:hypothetical protein